MSKRVAIIGLGISGLSVLREYVRVQEQENIEIIVFDGINLGTGLPYQQDDDSLLLNQISETMSMNPSNSNDFVEWLEKNFAIENAAKLHIPRTHYGEYLKDYLMKLTRQGRITFIQKNVTDLTIVGKNKYRVNCQEVSFIVNAIHLCTGHLPYKDPYLLRGKKEYIHQPYPFNIKLMPLLRSDTRSIAIVGTGLTALDIMLYVSKLKKDVQMHFLSLDGAFTSVRGNIVLNELHYLTNNKIVDYIHAYGDFISLNQYIQWLELEGKRNGIEVSKIWYDLGEGTPEGITKDFEHLNELGILQGIIHQLDDILPLIWSTLTNEDRKKFLKVYGEKWHKFRSPMPQKTANKLLELYDKKAVILHKNIQSIDFVEDRFEINLLTDQLHVGFIINATGQEMDIDKAKLQDSFLYNLVNKRILKKESFGGIEVEWPSQSVYSSKYGILKTMKAHGQLVGGIQFGNNTMGMLSSSAIFSVQHMLDFIKKEECNEITSL